MFYTEEIKLDQAAALLSACQLRKPQGVDYTVGVFLRSSGFGGSGGFDGFGAQGEDRLVACGSLKGDMIQGVAVDPAFQGEDLTAKLLTHLAAQSAAKGNRSLYLFTKPEKAAQFAGLGFRLIASARPYAALLEWGESGIAEYKEKLKTFRESAELRCGTPKSPEQTEHPESPIGSLVMNCNPFTKGHRFLVEQAASACRHVFLLVVEEDASLFSFDDRFAMVKAGTADLENVIVIPGGRYVVSGLTFPGYFTKEENLASAHAAIDAELFAAQIAPVLGVQVRFVGTEPFSPVTERYNEALKKRLPRAGIQIEEIPRLSVEGEAVSATRVRRILQEDGIDCGEARDKLAKLLPKTTLDYLLQPEVQRRLGERMHD